MGYPVVKLWWTVCGSGSAEGYSEGALIQILKSNIVWEEVPVLEINPHVGAASGPLLWGVLAEKPFPAPTPRHSFGRPISTRNELHPLAFETFGSPWSYFGFALPGRLNPTSEVGSGPDIPPHHHPRKSTHRSSLPAGLTIYRSTGKIRGWQCFQWYKNQTCRREKNRLHWKPEMKSKPKMQW